MKDPTIVLPPGQCPQWSLQDRMRTSTSMRIRCVYMRRIDEQLTSFKDGQLRITLTHSINTKIMMVSISYNPQLLPNTLNCIGYNLDINIHPQNN